MRFHDPERFEKYCVAKRRTYLRQLAMGGTPARFFDLWHGEFELSGNGFQIAGLPEKTAGGMARDLRWLLLSDLYTLARRFVPDLPVAPATVLESLTGGLHQVRYSRSMLITGEDGAGKETLAILLHVLAGRPGALVRIPARELGRKGRPNTKQLMPERGSVFLGNLEEIAPAAQDELLAFLNGDARRRDLLFFASTRARPWELPGRHGIRRELLIRVSQTEIRLPRIATRAHDIADFIGDIVFDKVRVESGRMTDLRVEADRLAAEWRSDRGIPSPQDYDFVSEALSYALWREKARLAARCLETFDAFGLPQEGSFRQIEDLAVERLRSLDGSGDKKAARKGPPADKENPELQQDLPTQLSRDELLRAYYRRLVEEEDGDLQAVARRAGQEPSNLVAEFTQLGIAGAERRKGAAPNQGTRHSRVLSHPAKPGT